MHYRPLCYFAAQLIGDPADAEDIAKDSFVKLWHRHADFDSPQSIKSFLYVTTRNAGINFLRRQKVKNTFSREFAYLEESRREELVLNQLIRAEFMQEIYNEIEKLPGKRREVFKLAYFEGLKNDEIAERLDISVFTVKVHKGKALTTLRLRFSDRQVVLFTLLGATCLELQEHSLRVVHWLHL
jgi:RNA polymerase sigma-70 factor (ECF subfamily)